MRFFQLHAMVKRKEHANAIFNANSNPNRKLTIASFLTFK